MQLDERERELRWVATLAGADEPEHRIEAPEDSRRTETKGRATHMRVTPPSWPCNSTGAYIHGTHEASTRVRALGDVILLPLRLHSEGRLEGRRWRGLILRLVVVST